MSITLYLVEDMEEKDEKVQPALYGPADPVNSA